MNIERQKRGLPSLQEAEAQHGMIAPDNDGKCPEGYKMGEDGMCHLETAPGHGASEATTHKKIIEQLTAEVDKARENLSKVDALKAERDQLRRKLEEQRSLYKAIEDGKRLAMPTRGKVFTQTPDTIATGKIESLEDSAGLYNYYVQQGFSRKDAKDAVLLRVLEQEGLA